MQKFALNMNFKSFHSNKYQCFETGIQQMRQVCYYQKIFQTFFPKTLFFLWELLKLFQISNQLFLCNALDFCKVLTT